MRILLVSTVYPPSVGGVETVGQMLSEGLCRRGHEVRVVTSTPDAGEISPGIERRPSPLTLIRAFLWSDVVLLNHPGVRLGWPALVLPRPVVAVVHNWLRLESWLLRWLLLALDRLVAVSDVVARHLPAPAVVIPNGYRGDQFFEEPMVERDIDLLFVGRLVPDKGLHILVEALGILRARGVHPSLVVAGEGPERERLEQRARPFGAVFRGGVTGSELRRLYNRAKVAVVSSVWEEPFGLVALEALACGCLPVVSRSGALPEVGGRCAVVVENGNPEPLAEALKSLLAAPKRRSALLAKRKAHLAQFSPAKQIDRYLAVLGGGLWESV